MKNRLVSLAFLAVAVPIVVFQLAVNPAGLFQSKRQSEERLLRTTRNQMRQLLESKRGTSFEDWHWTDKERYEAMNRTLAELGEKAPEPD